MFVGYRVGDGVEMYTTIGLLLGILVGDGVERTIGDGVGAASFNKEYATSIF